MMVSNGAYLIFHIVLMSLVWAVPALNGHLRNTATHHAIRVRSLLQRRLGSMSQSSEDMIVTEKEPQPPTHPHPSPPLYVQEGLFAVNKPLEWTSQEVVGKIRWLLEQDAKQRGVVDVRIKRRNPWIKVGHGGTLDPLATGVLVIGVGRGTKELQQYLTGSKGYRAEMELGFQTTTLDLDPKGDVVARKPFDHVTLEQVESILPQFRGAIQQTPPIFSALRKDGKRLYELGRAGMTAEDIDIESRQVQIHRLDLFLDKNTNINDGADGNSEKKPISHFGIDVECGGGTYIRSLVRDIGLALDTVATMTSLVRTKQGVFLPEHCLEEIQWSSSVESIWEAIQSSRDILATFDNDQAVNDSRLDAET